MILIFEEIYLNNGKRDKVLSFFHNKIKDDVFGMSGSIGCIGSAASTKHYVIFHKIPKNAHTPGLITFYRSILLRIKYFVQFCLKLQINQLLLSCVISFSLQH